MRRSNSLRDILRQSTERKLKRSIAGRIRPIIQEEGEEELLEEKFLQTPLCESNQIAAYVAATLLEEPDVKDVLRYDGLKFVVIKYGTELLPQSLTDKIAANIEKGVNPQLGVLDVNYLQHSTLGPLGKKMYGRLRPEMVTTQPEIIDILKRGRLYDAESESFCLPLEAKYPEAINLLEQAKAKKHDHYHPQPQQDLRPLT